MILFTHLFKFLGATSKTPYHSSDIASLYNILGELMSKKVKRFARNEFRYNYVTQHPNYIFEEEGNKYHSIGITHHKKTRDKNKKWHKNMPLYQNPQKNKKQKSYMRYGFITQNKKTYGNVDMRYSWSASDKMKVRTKIHTYKNIRRKK